MTTADPGTPTPGAKIKVLGIGGGGTNAVSSMIRADVGGVDFVCANTDCQSLHAALAPRKIQLGKDLTKGLGAGADPDIGRDAALEDRQEILESIQGADMVFITAGMGGGTGTGGASIAAQIAKDSGALTVGVVTRPFRFEGRRRRRHADHGIERLREHVDTLLVIPNDRLLEVAGPHLSMLDAFRLADNVLVDAVRGISDIINVPGTINVDFADVKTVMANMGQALMGVGSASGENRAQRAAREAISSPLLEDVDIEGATGLLINITAASSVSLSEVHEACSIIEDAAHDDANIIFGAVIDPALEDEIRITVIATGFPVARDAQYIIRPIPERAPISRSVSYHASERRTGDSGQIASETRHRYGAAVAESSSPSPSAPASEDPSHLAMPADVELTQWTFENLSDSVDADLGELGATSHASSYEPSPKLGLDLPDPREAQPAVRPSPREPQLDPTASDILPKRCAEATATAANPVSSREVEPSPSPRFETIKTDLQADLDYRIQKAMSKHVPQDILAVAFEPSNDFEIPSYLRGSSEGQPAKTP